MFKKEFNQLSRRWSLLNTYAETVRAVLECEADPDLKLWVLGMCDAVLEHENEHLPMDVYLMITGELKVSANTPKGVLPGKDFWREYIDRKGYGIWFSVRVPLKSGD